MRAGCEKNVFLTDIKTRFIGVTPACVEFFSLSGWENTFRLIIPDSVLPFIYCRGVFVLLCGYTRRLSAFSSSLQLPLKSSLSNPRYDRKYYGALYKLVSAMLPGSILYGLSLKLEDKIFK